MRALLTLHYLDRGLLAIYLALTGVFGVWLIIEKVIEYIRYRRINGAANFKGFVFQYAEWEFSFPFRYLAVSQVLAALFLLFKFIYSML